MVLLHGLAAKADAQNMRGTALLAANILPNYQKLAPQITR